jgi:regulatory protein YycI of two-component signal transduction system YycFG
MRNILFIIILLILTILYSLQLQASQQTNTSLKETNKRLNSIEKVLEMNTINTVD